MSEPGEETIDEASLEAATGGMDNWIEPHLLCPTCGSPGCATH